PGPTGSVLLPPPDRWRRAPLRRRNGVHRRGRDERDGSALVAPQVTPAEARSSSSIGCTTSIGLPIARSCAASCIEHPGFALATIDAPVPATASAFSRPSAPAASGWVTL